MCELNLQRLEKELDSIRHCWTINENTKLTTLTFLKKQLPHINNSSWQKRMEIGGIYINGKRVDENTTLYPCRLEYFEAKFDIHNMDSHFPRFEENLILYEDTDILAFFKPKKLASTFTRVQKYHTAKKYIEDYLGTTIHMPSRLDKSAQGLLLVSKSKRMNNRLQKMFEEKKIQKKYKLLVPKKVPWSEKTVENKIGYHEKHPILRRITEKGKNAITHFRFLKEKQWNGIIVSLLEAQPVTGRTHQIRIHAASLGMPIVGDCFYNGIEHNQLCLLSDEVTFWHEYNKKTTSIKVPQSLYPEWA